MESKQWGITKLYNEYFHEPTSQLYKLHVKLDQLVMQAYGFSEDDDILSKLLELNLELAEREKQGLPVIGAKSWIKMTQQYYSNFQSSKVHIVLCKICNQKA